MDAFEARLQFVQVIKNLHKTLHKKRDTSPSGAALSSSGSSSGSAFTDPVQFYLKHFEHHYEDFQQCFFETALNMDSLDRLNVLIYWSRIISSLWPRCLKNVDGQWNIQGKVLFEFLLLDLNKMVDIVLPKEDWKSLTNLDVSIEVLQFIISLVKSDSNALNFEPYKEDGLEKYQKLLELDRSHIVDQFSESIWNKINEKSFEFEWVEHTKQPTCEQSIIQCLQILVDRRSKAFILQEAYRKHLVLNLPNTSQLPTVLHRMENDRERHKKSKEHRWFIERDDMMDTIEFDTIWNSFSLGMNRNDYQNIKTIQEIAQASYKYLEN
ncbi:CTD kinase subunit gamma [Kluyveromyces marxianus]|uniref:CTD kinase subunit gamma n=2 Tax=Kluyveromyces marxianus TaxID=4911 RepID=W0T469_KLUMD|nr:CTD kinase subunit gamma [Kluyveromyces marxianus DMKU3-1042]QGN13615.1 CTD kinase subunit gamma [Kluyveromyces marxianus]BAO38205.1 CTD kinase subunit gamma [Kluyveromyces marxianus DMKU3-1042]BAP69771.1 CTD kinase subunit gamma [Kluyveromyces marxianus]